MAKTIVTHRNPDLDAIMSVWLLMRFDQPRYGDAKLVFVPAGSTYKGNPVDSDPEVTHVDMGGGRFDHHQEGAYGTCASELVYRSLVEEGLIKPSDLMVKAMVEYALAIDLFQDKEWPEASELRYAFTLAEIIPALHQLQVHDNEAVVRMVLVQLDGVYQRLKTGQKAREAIKQGQEFSSKWGKGILVKTSGDGVHKIAQKMGYRIVVEQNEKGYVRIKTAPEVRRSLQEIYDKISARDGAEKWFYHNSGHMLLNGSGKGPELEPTSLSAAQILKLIEGN